MTSNHSVRSVLISGASIAGPALAYWLHQHGFKPTIVEVAPALRPGGHAVDVRGVARDVVQRMGIMSRVREFCVDERGIAYVDGRDRVRSRLPAEAFGGEGIVAEIEIMRGDLSAVLYEATHSFTEYLFGDRIVELTQGSDGVKATFASGTTRCFDLVIGADGVHSGVRALAFGPEEEFVRSMGGYTAYFTVPDPGDLNNWFLMYNEPGVCAGIRPERGGTAKASLSFASREPIAYDRRDVDQQRDLLMRRFARAGWRVPGMLVAMPAAPDFYLDSVCQVHVGQWARGRIGLIGDAAYSGSPLTGMGTSTSLVGAYVLAGELASTPDDPEGAMHRYQNEMKDYVTQCQQLPPGGFNGMVPTSRFMIHLRTLSMRMMTRWPMRGMVEKLFHRADAITLKEYATR